METNKINFDKAKLEEFKKHYQRAIKEKKDVFEFEGHPILVAYAKYMIEYLTNEMKDDL